MKSLRHFPLLASALVFSSLVGGRAPEEARATKGNEPEPPDPRARRARGVMSRRFVPSVFGNHHNARPFWNGNDHDPERVRRAEEKRARKAAAWGHFLSLSRRGALGGTVMEVVR